VKYSSVFSPSLFAGQTIIVTGGGSGIGRCIAHEFTALGANVVIVGRTKSKLLAVQEEITEDGGEVFVQSGDIRDEAAVIEIIENTLSRYGCISGLVNNAGGQFRTGAENISTKGFEAVIRTNLTGGFIFMREIYSRYMKENGGNIVNIIADIWNGWPDFSHSGAARGGMLTLSQALACEWGADNVRVNTVAPGGIASSGFDTYPDAARQALLEYPDKIPLQRYGTESEVAAAVVFLLSPAAAYITGSCIRVDGGAPNARQTWSLKKSKKNEPFNGFHRSAEPELLKQRV
jgi:citronellol/citronellal dehydrogenase